MSCKKTLVIVLASLLVTTVLVSVVSCGPTPVPPTSAPTAQPSAPPATAVPVAPTAAPVPTKVPGPLVKIKEPSAESLIQIVGLSANANMAQEPNAITATIKYITDTKVGEASTTRGLGVAGLANHPVNVPMHLALNVATPPKTVRWAVSGPAGTKAAIKDAAAVKTEFTPDLVGVYLVTVTVTDAAGASKTDGIQIHAGTYIGATDGNCKTCHADKAAEWAKTNHATLFSREMDNKYDGPMNVKTHYSESCTTCHTTGFYPPPFGGSGGYYDVKAKSGWKFPTWDLIDGAWEKKNPSNWDAAPPAVKNMASISCENCHGPAKEHVTQGASVMVSSLNNDVCDQCHGAAANHSKGWQIANSKHTTGTSFEEINGPARQACMRCHGGEGFISFLAKPKEQAAWSNEPGSIGCSTCHEPHSEANYAQLRVVGKPVEMPFEAKNDVGLSAICFTCHNGRVNAEDFAAGKTTSTPHYSTAAEMLSGAGGITYGQTLPSSAAHLSLGMSPIKNPAYDGKDLSVAQFLFSKPLDAKGNVPGPCVTCHMTAPVTAPLTDTLAFKVGGHSFNTTSPDGKDYGAACKSCHGDVKDFSAINLSNKDFDGNGKVEGAQVEIKGLLNVLWKAMEAKGVKQVAGHPYATLPTGADGKVDPKINNAWFNYRFVYGVSWSAGPGGTIIPGNEGAASAAHNYKRSVSLLQLSLKDLTGSLPAGMADGTK